MDLAVCNCVFDQTSPSSSQVVIGLDDRWTLICSSCLNVSFQLGTASLCDGTFAFFNLALSIAVQALKNAMMLQAKSEKSSPPKRMERHDDNDDDDDDDYYDDGDADD